MSDITAEELERKFKEMHWENRKEQELLQTIGELRSLLIKKDDVKEQWKQKAERYEEALEEIADKSMFVRDRRIAIKALEESE